MMKVTVISYSQTGNNQALAAAIAKHYSAEHISIREVNKRNYWRIGMDLLFNRKPAITPSLDQVDTSGRVLLVGPVWMGRLCSPMRTCLHQLRSRLSQYAFVTLRGGGEEVSPPELEAELTRRTGVRPFAVVDLPIYHLSPEGPRPSPEEIFNFRLTEAEAQKLVPGIAEKLGK